MDNKKASVVGAITQTKGEVLERAGGVYSVGAALTCNQPGVITTSSTGIPGEEDQKILIRAMSSWNNAEPLVLVEGQKMVRKVEKGPSRDLPTVKTPVHPKNFDRN